MYACVAGFCITSSPQSEAPTGCLSLKARQYASVVDGASGSRPRQWWAGVKRQMSKWFTAAEEPAAPDALELARRAEQAGDHQTAAQLYWHVTQSYVDAGQYDRAAETLEQATRLVPEQADLHNARAQCLIRLGRKVEAAAGVSPRRGVCPRPGARSLGPRTHPDRGLVDAQRRPRARADPERRGRNPAGRSPAFSPDDRQRAAGTRARP